MFSKKNMKLQVFLDPPGHTAFGGINTFSGIHSDSLEKLLSIVRVRYMGAAEFEFGTLGKCLTAIAKDRPRYALHEREIKGKKFFILIPADKLEEYCQKMKELSESNFSSQEKGWLDIYENVLFFVDEDMAKKMDEFLHMEDE